MEEETINTEEEILNGDMSEDEISEDDDVVYTKAELDAILKKHQSDSDKGVQKILSEQKLYKEVIAQSKKVANNAEYLLDLYNSNEQVAKIILDEYFDGESIEDFKIRNGYEEDLNNPEITKKLVEQKATKMYQDKLIEDKKLAFIDKLKMTDAEKKDFEEAFNERKQLKSFNLETIDKHFEKAYREVNDTVDFKTLNTQETIAKSLATGEGKSSGGQGVKKGENTLDKEVGDFLSKFLK